MTYYAIAPDKVSKEWEEGAIEITREQYKEAIDILCNVHDMRIISTEGGVLSFVEVPKPEEPKRPEPTRKELILHAALQYLDKVANDLGYVGETNLVSYLNSSDPKWAAEARSYIDFRDTVWKYAYSFEGPMEEFNPPDYEAPE